MRTPSDVQPRRHSPDVTSGESIGAFLQRELKQQRGSATLGGASGEQQPKPQSRMNTGLFR
jgi:hypothetical protein